MRDRVGIVLHKIVPSEKGKAKFELKFIHFVTGIRLQWTDHRVLGSGCRKLRSFCMNKKFNVIDCLIYIHRLLFFLQICSPIKSGLVSASN